MRPELQDVSGRKAYCVPSSLSSILGVATEEVEALLVKCGYKKKEVCGVTRTMTECALEEFEVRFEMAFRAVRGVKVTIDEALGTMFEPGVYIGASSAHMFAFQVYERGLVTVTDNGHWFSREVKNYRGGRRAALIYVLRIQAVPPKRRIQELLEDVRDLIPKQHEKLRVTAFDLTKDQRNFFRDLGDLSNEVSLKPRANRWNYKKMYFKLKGQSKGKEFIAGLKNFKGGNLSHFPTACFDLEDKNGLRLFIRSIMNNEGEPKSYESLFLFDRFALGPGMHKISKNVKYMANSMDKYLDKYIAEDEIPEGSRTKVQWVREGIKLLSDGNAHILMFEERSGGMDWDFWDGKVMRVLNKYSGRL